MYMSDKTQNKPSQSTSDEELVKVFEELQGLGFRVLVYPDDLLNFYIQGGQMTRLFIDLLRQMRAKWTPDRRSWALERLKARNFKDSVDVECAIMEKPPLDRIEIERRVLALCRENQLKCYLDDTGFLFEDLPNYVSGVRRYGTQIDPEDQNWFVPKMRDYHLLCDLMRDVKYHAASCRSLTKSL